MDQYLLIPFLVGWTSIYQLFWCSPGVQGFDTLPYNDRFIGDLVGSSWQLIGDAISESRGLKGEFDGYVNWESHETMDLYGILWPQTKHDMLVIGHHSISSGFHGWKCTFQPTARCGLCFFEGVGGGIETNEQIILRNCWKCRKEIHENKFPWFWMDEIWIKTTKLCGLLTGRITPLPNLRIQEPCLRYRFEQCACPIMPPFIEYVYIYILYFQK